MPTPQQQTYIDQLRAFPAQLEALVRPLSDAQLEMRESPHEWSVRQIVHHLADSHLNTMARFKLPLTEEQPTIRPYDQDKWAQLADYALPLESSLRILRGLHERFVALLNSLTPEQWQRPLRHPDSGELVVEDVARIYAGHGLDHIAQIRRALGLRD
ncbi:MAG: putative metal-dependent hydrolase [Chloroflexi bacterium]|nr:putative metal-dependent hydrolase [Chloroflexota bacterium]